MSLEFKWVGGEEARAMDLPLHLDWPDDSHVLVSTEINDVTGQSSMSILPIVMLTIIEGTWIREDHRNTTLAFRLLKEVEKHLIEEGKTHAFAFTWDQQPEVGDYLSRVGYERKEISVWMKQLIAT